MRKLDWRCHLPNLLIEMMQGNPSGSVFYQPINITRSLLAELAELANEIDDPRLHILMLRLSLYDVPPERVTALIKEQQKRIESRTHVHSQ